VKVVAVRIEVVLVSDGDVRHSRRTATFSRTQVEAARLDIGQLGALLRGAEAGDHDGYFDVDAETGPLVPHAFYDLVESDPFGRPVPSRDVPTRPQRNSTMRSLQAITDVPIATDPVPKCARVVRVKLGGQTVEGQCGHVRVLHEPGLDGEPHAGRCTLCRCDLFETEDTDTEPG